MGCPRESAAKGGAHGQSSGCQLRNRPQFRAYLGTVGFGNMFAATLSGRFWLPLMGDVLFMGTLHEERVTSAFPSCGAQCGAH